MNKIDIQFDNLKVNEYYVGFCKLSKNEKEIAKKNPHCVEFFCNIKNIYNYTCYTQSLIKNKLFKINPLYNKSDKDIIYKTMNKNNKSCSKNILKDGYVYDFLVADYELDELKNKTNKIDLEKNIKTFYKNELIHKYDNLPSHLKWESTIPKPKSVVHWGQLKMFLVILLFLTKIIDTLDEKVDIIYPGSAHGDNILILSELFPNVNWYLIDPGQFNKNLFKHKKVIEIKNDFFTDDTAKYYYELFKNRKNKLLFISDIRLTTTDENIKDDNLADARWHNIIKPDYSYLKFRCPYEGNNEYKFYDGKIYLQPFAPPNSTESRLLCEKELIPKVYNIKEYQNKFYYFNRVLRPSYYIKSIIEENNYFDHCYDCTYFSYLIKNYLSKYNKKNNILSLMNYVVSELKKSVMDKIQITNEYIKNNIK